MTTAARECAQLNQWYGFPLAVVASIAGVSRQAVHKAIRTGRLETRAVTLPSGETLVWAAYEGVESLGRSKPATTRAGTPTPESSHRPARPKSRAAGRAVERIEE